MALDLKKMSRKELEKHLKEVKKALTNLQARERREARKAAENAAAKFGFTLNELTESAAKPAARGRKKAKAPAKKSKPQFANPADASQTWTGKGRQPNWYREAVAKGASPDSMRI